MCMCTTSLTQWENVHGIKPLGSGSRWAFSVPFFVDDAEGLENGLHEHRTITPRGKSFHQTCVHPGDKSHYPHCRGLWAAAMHAP